LHPNNLRRQRLGWSDSQARDKSTAHKHQSYTCKFNTCTIAKMFGGPPPQLSAAELKAQEDEAMSTVQRIIAGAVLLYLSPFAVDTIKKLV